MDMDREVVLKYAGAEPQVRGQFDVLLAQQFGFKELVPHINDDDFYRVVVRANEFLADN